MTKRPIKRKSANTALHRPDPAARPKAVIDAVATEVGASGSRSAKRQTGAPDQPAAQKPTPPKPPGRRSQNSSKTPGKTPRPPRVRPLAQLVAAGAIGAVVVIAVLLVLRFGSQRTASWVADLSGAGAVEQQLSVALATIADLQQAVAALREQAGARENAARSTRTALAAQDKRIAGLDAAVAPIGQTVQALTRNLNAVQQKTDQMAEKFVLLEGEIGKAAQAVNRLAALRVPVGGTPPATAPTDSPGPARLAALEASLALINGTLATITSDLAKVRAAENTGDTQALADQRTRTDTLANQVSQAGQRVASFEKNLDRLAARTELVGLSVYYEVLAARLRRGLPFAGVLGRMVTALGEPVPALSAQSASGVQSRTQLAQALKTLVRTTPAAPAPAPKNADQPGAAKGWLDRLLARANGAITISKTDDRASGKKNAVAEATLAIALQRLEAGDLDAAIAIAARTPDDPGVRSWLASARALSAAEKALEALGLRVESAIERRAGEPS